MVFATDSPNTRNATKLKKAAHTTAHCGRSTRVETIVAIEFAASWNPFMKSKASASTISSTTTSNATLPLTPSPDAASARTASRVLEHDALDHIGHVLAFVGDRLEELIDLLQLDDLARVGLFAEELRERRAEHVVGLGLEPVDVAADAQHGVHMLHVLETGHRLLHLARAGDADLRELLRFGRDGADVVEEEALRDVLHQVQHV